ncbi:hypothetical protein GEMRC1_010767 [Eukaryota sp. GEM-RC1]
MSSYSSDYSTDSEPEWDGNDHKSPFFDFSSPPLPQQSQTTSFPSFGYAYADLEWRTRWLSLKLAILDQQSATLSSKFPDLLLSGSLDSTTCPLPQPISPSSFPLHPILSLHKRVPSTSPSFQPHDAIAALDSCDGIQNYFSLPIIRLPLFLRDQEKLYNDIKRMEPAVSVTPSIPANQPPTTVPKPETAVARDDSEPKNLIHIPSIRPASPFPDVSDDVLSQIDGYDSSDERYIKLHTDMSKSLKEEDVRMEKKVEQELKVLKKLKYSEKKEMYREISSVY